MSKKDDSKNYVGNWPQWFKELGPSAMLDFHLRANYNADAQTSYTMDELEAAKKVMDEQVAKRNRSRDNVVEAYLSSMSTFYKLKSISELNDHDRRSLDFRDARLAEAKATHLKEYGEEIVVSFRPVGGNHG